jgi:hypothetical protein
MHDQHQWQTLERFVEIRSPWLALIGEKLQDEQGQVLDYWRVEKVDSVVIVTVHQGGFLFPVPMYRPGVKTATLDFPGGRVPSGQTPTAVVPEILTRELGVTESALVRLSALNPTGWAIDSSFSNQKLYGFVAEISPTVSLSPERLGATYPTTPSGVSNLLKELTCLQCRAVLLEWWQSQSALE